MPLSSFRPSRLILRIQLCLLSTLVRTSLRLNTPLASPRSTALIHSVTTRFQVPVLIFQNRPITVESPNNNIHRTWLCPLRARRAVLMIPMLILVLVPHHQMLTWPRCVHIYVRT
jgi:hypothetical protein